MASRDQPPSDPGHEERIADLEEEAEGLRRGIDELYSRLEACECLLELVVRKATQVGDALEFAEAIDREIERAHTLRKKDDDPGIEWLGRVREVLLVSLPPAVREAIAKGQTKLSTLREQLRVIDGGKDDTPRQPPDKPA